MTPEFIALKSEVALLISAVSTLASVVRSQTAEIAALKAAATAPGDTPAEITAVSTDVATALAAVSDVLPAATPSTLAVDGLSHPALS